MDRNVAISFLPSPVSLRGAAHFSGREDSFIEVPTLEVTTKYGITVSAWVYLDRVDAGDQHFIVDASGPCSQGTEKYQSFYLWIEKSVPVESGSPAAAPEPCGAVTSDAPGGTGGPGEFIKVKALLCDGPVTGVSPTKDGTCKTFESADSMPLTVGQWEYCGFSFDEFTKKGTFIINKMFGYQGRSEKKALVQTQLLRDSEAPK